MLQPPPSRKLLRATDGNFVGNPPYQNDYGLKIVGYTEYQRNNKTRASSEIKERNMTRHHNHEIQKEDEFFTYHSQ